MSVYKVVLGLGSNKGDRRSFLASAISLLGENISSIKLSSLYESAALLPENAPAHWDIPFYNMAICGETALPPLELLGFVKDIEKKLGRNKTDHWGPREIDIDILAVNGVVIESLELTVPHKELVKRNFALMPLAELEPDWLHPLINKTAKELVQNLDWNGIRLVKKPKLVGIINVTPDSFSDGGDSFSIESAISNIQKLLEDGADVIDIGAESTRPGAVPISEDQEWQRLEPVLSVLKDKRLTISLDTRNPLTAKKALEMNVSWINDVSGFSNPEMVEIVKNSDCKLVVMHSLGVPASREVIIDDNQDAISVVLSWAQKRFAEMEESGIKANRIVFDPGIGFGKNAAQSQALINNISSFKKLGVPIFVGHSRKSFLGKGAGDDATIAVSQFLADLGIDYLRVHNVRRHKLEIL